MDLPLTPPTEYSIELELNRHHYFNEVSPQPGVVAVIGVGYVGVHLVATFSRCCRVIALDLSSKRRTELTQQFVDAPVEVTGDPARISDAAYILISVPTTLHHDNTIDARPLQAAISTVKSYAKDGATIVIESSVAIGMTRKLLGPLMMKTRQLYGGMSPERVDPGRKVPHFESIPKIVSGLDDIAPGSLHSIFKLYSTAFEKVVQVSSPEVAEMTKLYENCQRMVNIAYVNEMADACRSLGIDPLEVCAAASTKPFGYQPYTPGLGVGGHCIPVNPYYLLSTSHFPLLEAATKAMSVRPAQMAERIVQRVRDSSDIGHTQVRVLVVGVGFKRGQAVLSNSPGVQLIVSLLHDHECYVEFCDPLVLEEDLRFVPKYDHLTSWNKKEIELQFDAVAVVVDQLHLDLSILASMQNTILENFASALPWTPKTVEKAQVLGLNIQFATLNQQSSVSV